MKKYFTELPNLIDDLALSVWAYRVYGKIKRVAGDSGGICFQSTQTLAASCRMSVGQVSAAKKELALHGLIKRERSSKRTTEVITITDIWDRNFEKYKPSVHTVNTQRSGGEPQRSGGERSVHQVNDIHEEEPSKKNPGRRTHTARVNGSAYDLATCERFARTLRGIRNPDGYAKSIFRSGEDDDKIAAWLDRPERCENCKDTNGFDRRKYYDEGLLTHCVHEQKQKAAAG